MFLRKVFWEKCSLHIFVSFINILLFVLDYYLTPCYLLDLGVSFLVGLNIFYFKRNWIVFLVKVGLLA